MPDSGLHIELDALADFLTDGAGQPLTITVPEPLKPANQRLMDTLGVRVVVRPVSDSPVDYVRRAGTRGRTMAQYEPGYELSSGGGDGKPDWIDYRASVGRAERRLEAGEAVSRCWSCKTELDVPVPVHSPRCRTLGGASNGRAALDAMDNGVSQRDIDAQAVVESRDCVTPRCVREAENGSDFCRVCDEGLRVAAERVGHETAAVPAGTNRYQKPKREVETVRTSQRKWTREAIVAAIRRSALENGEPPKNDQWTKAAIGRPTSSTVAKEFGSWADAIEAAGFPRPTRGGAQGPRSSVREPKAREAAAGPPPASVVVVGTDGGAVDDGSSSPVAAEAGSRTDEHGDQADGHHEWLLSLGLNADMLAEEIARLDELSVLCIQRREALERFLDALREA